MGITKISDQVYSVGVQNPGLRVFDIIMESKYGTSYNAYLITGSKNVLVDTVHEDYFDEYLYNVQSLVDLHDIHYLVMNHTEPDHSGSVMRLLELCPNLTVICTFAAQRNLQQITNREFNCRVVKDNETLDIGNTELKFIVAPMLHWPDSMMTYHPLDKVLFTCDFLGCHFCEPTMLDSGLHYKDKYLSEFAYYYAGIFGPFKPFVIAGLDKIDGLEIEAACPSHGPVLVKEIRERMADYRKWSTNDKKVKKAAAVLYASAYGYTKQLALAAADALSAQGVEVEAVDMVFAPFDEVVAKANKADFLLIGTCTINRDAPKIVWDVLSSIDAINTKGKKAGAFGSYGWSGEAVAMVMSRLSQIGYKTVGDGLKVVFRPTEKDAEAIGHYALEVAAG